MYLYYCNINMDINYDIFINDLNILIGYYNSENKYCYDQVLYSFIDKYKNKYNKLYEYLNKENICDKLLYDILNDGK